jgi:hypothetical protein
MGDAARQADLRKFAYLHNGSCGRQWRISIGLADQLRGLPDVDGEVSANDFTVPQLPLPPIPAPLGNGEEELNNAAGDLPNEPNGLPEDDRVPDLERQLREADANARALAEIAARQRRRERENAEQAARQRRDEAVHAEGQVLRLRDGVNETLEQARERARVAEAAAQNAADLADRVRELHEQLGNVRDHTEEAERNHERQLRELALERERHAADHRTMQAQIQQMTGDMQRLENAAADATRALREAEAAHAQELRRMREEQDEAGVANGEEGANDAEVVDEASSEEDEAHDVDVPDVAAAEEEGLQHGPDLPELPLDVATYLAELTQAENYAADAARYVNAQARDPQPVDVEPVEQYPDPFRRRGEALVPNVDIFREYPGPGHPEYIEVRPEDYDERFDFAQARQYPPRTDIDEREAIGDPAGHRVYPPQIHAGTPLTADEALTILDVRRAARDRERVLMTRIFDTEYLPGQRPVSPVRPAHLQPPVRRRADDGRFLADPRRNRDAEEARAERQRQFGELRRSDRIRARLQARMQRPMVVGRLPFAQRQVQMQEQRRRPPILLPTAAGHRTVRQQDVQTLRRSARIAALEAARARRGG